MSLINIEPVSEATIKRAMLAFMKSYYKFRPRTGETIVNTDRMHPTGIIVDGYLEFPKEDGAPFVATFEATSAATAKEVKYTIQTQQLTWDAIAAGSILTVVVMAILWRANIITVFQTGWTGSIIVLVALFATLSALCYYIAHPFIRYRYIPAVEQFKQYHADEQWIALSNDVFPNNEDPEFFELRNQCVHFGFGLTSVNSDEHVNLLITPAREELFTHHRRSLNFTDNPAMVGLKNSIPINLDRFRRSYMTQVIICSISVLAVSGLFFKQWSQSSIQYVGSESKRFQDLESKLGDYQPESNEKYINPKDVVPIKTSGRDYVPVSNDKSEVGLYVYSPSEGYLTYDCARAGVRGRKYVVQDQICETFDEARNRIVKLKAFGLIANCISLKCTENATSKGYCVYYELIYNDQNSANKKAISIKQSLQSLNLPNEFVKIRILDF